MSDEELVKRLRDTCRGGETCKCSLNEAADRIEALIAKVAKAVGALRQIAEQTKGVTPEPDNLQIAIGSIHSYARAELAEIENSEAVTPYGLGEKL
jgi:hypothetical protein